MTTTLKQRIDDLLEKETVGLVEAQDIVRRLDRELKIAEKRLTLIREAAVTSQQTPMGRLNEITNLIYAPMYV